MSALGSVSAVDSAVNWQFCRLTDCSHICI